MEKPLTLILVALGTLAVGCGSGATTFRPAPNTPTDVKEAAQIQHLDRIYRRTTRIIRSEFSACVAKLPEGVAPRDCRLDVGALAVQRNRQLRGPLRHLFHHLGPLCTGAVAKVLIEPTSAGGASLDTAARVCRREYQKADVRP